MCMYVELVLDSGYSDNFSQVPATVFVRACNLHCTIPATMSTYATVVPIELDSEQDVAESSDIDLGLSDLDWLDENNNALQGEISLVDLDCIDSGIDIDCTSNDNTISLTPQSQNQTQTQNCVFPSLLIGPSRKRTCIDLDPDDDDGIPQMLVTTGSEHVDGAVQPIADGCDVDSEGSESSDGVPPPPSTDSADTSDNEMSDIEIVIAAVQSCCAPDHNELLPGGDNDDVVEYGLALLDMVYADAQAPSTPTMTPPDAEYVNNDAMNPANGDSDSEWCDSMQVNASDLDAD